MKAIYPAIDLMGGEVVRLQEGAFETKKTYSLDPIEAALSFEKAGASLLHVVDLDGAKAQETKQTALIKRLCAATNLKVQVGGGVRSLKDVTKLLEAGADRVVIGSLAVKDPQAFTAILKEVTGAKVTLGLDCHLDEKGNAHVATHGWQHTSNETASSLLDRYSALGLTRVLCTDIKKDGMLKGPNFALYRSLAALYPHMEFLASGGVSCKEDVFELKKTGAYGAIIGKALYEGRLDLKEVLT